ncbi:MAG: YolD-like family protein [Acholeplasmataceae bacterium]
MDDYQDRGIIKWLPFDGLVGFYDLIKDLKYKLGKKDKPILSDDKLFIMDLTIKEAYSYKKEVLISYFNNGYIKETFGIILNIDLINKTIYLNNSLKLHLDLIVDLKML